jgi:hypothetical protein
MKRSDGDGRAVRGKACEDGWCVGDSLRRVPTVGTVTRNVTVLGSITFKLLLVQDRPQVDDLGTRLRRPQRYY